MAPLTPDDIQKLSVDERFDLIEALWDSLEAEAKALPLTDAQRVELDRRLDEQDPRPLIPWDQVRDQLRRG